MPGEEMEMVLGSRCKSKSLGHLTCFHLSSPPGLVKDCPW